LKTLTQSSILSPQHPEKFPPAIFLMGPTASGKTQVALELSQHLPVEIISVDSAQVYRGMDIGTAKPDMATLSRAPHHLIDIIDPTASYSAAAFCRDTLHLMQDITQRGKIPLLVGGTMLYFRALQKGLSPLPEADATVRAELNREIEQYGVQQLHQQLVKVDADTAARLSPNDTQRIQRAMEIYRLTGQPMSVLIQQQTQHSLPYRIISLSLQPSERAELHARIATRFSAMLEHGLIDELSGLQKRYALHPDLPAMRCVGYRQAWQFLAAEINRAELLDKGIFATRQLAKRQITWLRSMPDNIEFDCLGPDLAQRVLTVLQPILI
jgi:tRNA dimethylallyltransferase